MTLLAALFLLPATQPVSADTAVNTFTTNTQNRPAIAGDGAGNFIVVWQSFGQDGDELGDFGRRFDPWDDLSANEFSVNTYTSGNQSTPRVAADEAGNFIVVWAGDGGVGAENGVFAQRFDPSGARVGDEIQLNFFPSLRPLHGHPRFEALLESLELPTLSDQKNIG